MTYDLIENLYVSSIYLPTMMLVIESKKMMFGF